jgi:hypothetical protein
MVDPGEREFEGSIAGQLRFVPRPSASDAEGAPRPRRWVRNRFIDALPDGFLTMSPSAVAGFRRAKAS